jgi:Family of unknown function (DUF6492)
MTRTAIFIRSYWKDLAWLAYCLRSIQLFCEGFSEVVVTLPETSRPWLRRTSLPDVAKVIFVPSCADDYLGQQATKLFADTYCEADFIAHVDADCIFVRPVAPNDLHPGGRPLSLTKPVADLGRHYPWGKPTEHFLGFSAELDFMQRPPFVFPRWLYPALSEHCLSRHGTTLDRYVLSRPPRGFSEFNALGAFAWRRHRDRFLFLDADSPDAPAPFCDWHWSWGGLTPPIRAAIEELLDTAPSRKGVP